MIRNIFVLLLILSSTVVFGQETASVKTNGEGVSAAPPAPKFLKISWISSRTGQKNDFRNIQTTSSDESGSMSESSAIPNLNYLAAFGIMPVSSNSSVGFAGLEGMDSRETRTIPTPFGRDFVLPQHLVAGFYKYNLPRGYFVDAKAVYIDTFGGFMDPAFGFGFQQKARLGLSQKYSLSSSVPVTNYSHTQHFLTRTTVKAHVSYDWMRWNAFVGAAHSRSFRNGPAPERSHSSSSASTQSPSSHALATPPYGSGRPQFNETDLVLMEREVYRNTLRLGGGYSFSDAFKFTSVAGMTQVHTEKTNNIWITMAKPIGFSYGVDQWEVATDLGYYSDINNYKAPTLPTLWSVSMRLTYTL